MLISASVRRSGPSPREKKKSRRSVLFADMVNKRFAELCAHWRQTMVRYGVAGKPRIPAKIREVLRAEAKQFAAAKLQ